MSKYFYLNFNSKKQSAYNLNLKSNRISQTKNMRFYFILNSKVKWKLNLAFLIKT